MSHQTPFQVQLKRFYQTLIEQANQPTRLSLKQGIYWLGKRELPSSDSATSGKAPPCVGRGGGRQRLGHQPLGRCIYHHVYVQPYCGHESSEIYGDRVIPRIYLNLFTNFPISARQRRLWSGNGSAEVVQSNTRLELTTTLEELPDFATWLLRWVKAKDENDGNLILPLPYPLALDDKIKVFDAEYLWTQAASDEYEARCQRRQQRQATISTSL